MRKIKAGLVVFLAVFMLSATAWAASIADQMTKPAAGPSQTQQTQLRETPQRPQTESLPRQMDTSDELVYVEKGLYLITNAKKAELTRKLEEINKKYDVHVGIHIVNSLPAGAKDLETEAKRFAESGAYNEGKNGSMVLYITMSNRKYYIATGNYMNRRITSAEGIPYIKEEIVPRLKDNHFDDAMEAFVEAAEKELAYFEEEGEPYDPSEEFSWSALFIAAIFSGLAGCSAWSYFVSTMSNVEHAVAADEYLERDTFELTGETDTYLYTTTSVVPKSQGNDDDSDDGGSSSDDGGSSGGGGGSF